jgi:hypothetical protein
VDVGIVLLRLAHIGGGVLWAGGAVLITWFIEPTAANLGPKAGPFMNALTARKIGIYFTIAAGLAVVAGSALYWIDSGGSIVAFFTGGSFGFALGLGGLAAWAAFFIGLTLVRPLTDRMGAVGQQLASSEGAPPPELVAEMQRIQEDLHRFGLIDFWLIAAAVVLMAVARSL